MKNNRLNSRLGLQVKHIPISGLILASVCVLMSSAAVGDDPNPFASLKGDGFTPSSNVIGTSAQGTLAFSFNVTGKSNGSATGLETESRLSASAKNGPLDQITSRHVNVQCLVIDKNTAWWSGTVTFYTDSPQFNETENQNFRDDVAIGQVMQYGRLTDLFPGKDQRSLFGITSLVSRVPLNDPGTVNTVSKFPVGTTGKNICKLKNGIFANKADYKQVKSDKAAGTASIIWLAPDDETEVSKELSISNPIEAEQVLGNPPDESLYAIPEGALIRNFDGGNIEIARVQ